VALVDLFSHLAFSKEKSSGQRGLFQRGAVACDRFHVFGNAACQPPQRLSRMISMACLCLCCHTHTHAFYNSPPPPPETNRHRVRSRPRLIRIPTPFIQISSKGSVGPIGSSLSLTRCETLGLRPDLPRRLPTPLAFIIIIPFRFIRSIHPHYGIHPGPP